MYRSLMVPLDGSLFAEQALPLALAVSRQTGAVLHLVHVHDPQVAKIPTRVAEDHDYPAGVARQVAEQLDVAPRTARLEGKVLDQLIAYTGREEIEFVVIATHGRGGLSRARIGSTTDSLIRQLHIPILTLRPQELESRKGGAGATTAEPTERRIAEHDPIGHILVPLDGSALAEAVLPHAIALGGPELRLSLVQAVPAPVPNDPTSLSFVLTVDQTTIDAELARGLAYLDRSAESLAEQVRRVDTAVLLEPRPVAAILDYADQNDVDLIALATHGRGGLRRLALGSSADKLLRAAHLPVLVFRSDES
jgi:nucleotide-binding universal stress UspA family protein